MNSTISHPNDPAYFDVREISCREKHARIFQRWNLLSVGTHFVLVNDHDPVPLYYQFEHQFPGAFTWEYLLQGPDEFQVKITRTAVTVAPAALTPPNGGCGSHRTPSALLDVRGLEPPEPMMNILSALEILPVGRELRAVTDRKPVHLLEELDSRGIAHRSEEQTDGSWLSTFRRN